MDKHTLLGQCKIKCAFKDAWMLDGMYWALVLTLQMGGPSSKLYIYIYTNICLETWSGAWAKCMVMWNTSQLNRNNLIQYFWTWYADVLLEISKLLDAYACSWVSFHALEPTMCTPRDHLVNGSDLAQPFCEWLGAGWNAVCDHFGGDSERFERIQNNMDAMLYDHFANGSNPAQPLHEWLHAARKYSIPRC